MFDVIPSRLVGVFLMFGFEWSLLVKIIYGLGGSVYNLNNVPLDVDPKCIFVVQIYYRVFFLNESVKNRDFFLSLFGAWDGACGAVTSCLKLHEVFTKPSIPLQSALSGFFFYSLSQNGGKKGAFRWLVGLLMKHPSYFDFIYYLKL